MSEGFTPPTPKQVAARNLELANLRVETCREDFRRASVALHEAKNAAVIALVEHARQNPPPLAGVTVYRVMGGKETRHRLETGRVVLMENPDKEAAHIPVGTYYIRLDSGGAAWLDDNWKPELF